MQDLSCTCRAVKFFIQKGVFCGTLFCAAATGVLAADSVNPPPLSQTPLPQSLANIRTPQFDKTMTADLYTQKNAEPISLNFTNIKVRELLQIIAQFTKLNFVITDNVKGEMSIHLHQVPWTQALDVILKSQDLGERHVGNIIYIAPVGDLMKQQIAELEADQRMRDLVPLEDKVIHLNYADAVEVQKILDTKNYSLLSSRGSTNVDKRTNAVWVRDTPDHVKTIMKMIKQLDFPVEQVMIEARIVSVGKEFERQLGAKFGLTQPSNLSGTLQGANEMATGLNSQGTALNNGQTGPSSIPLADRLNFNIPAATLFGSTASPGSIGMAVAKLGSSFIDMELSALEEENNISIISSPRLITSNQQKAYIATGEQIPYQAASSSGATAVSFAQAELRLEVTPQITPDNRVILNLTITNNSAGTPISLQVPGGQATPGTQGTAGSAIPINTEEEQSRVLLNNNQTVVLGGVYQRTKSNVVTRIPFLGKLPIIGHLFKNTDRHTKDDELLIFLTPHIIHKPSDIS